MNLWSLVKQWTFPRGDALLVFVALYTVLFTFRLRQSFDLSEVAAAGLFASVGVLTEMVVAFLGDGNQELQKHLFLANLFFDIATVLAIVVSMLLMIDCWRRRSRVVLDRDTFTRTPPSAFSVTLSVKSELHLTNPRGLDTTLNRPSF